MVGFGGPVIPPHIWCLEVYRVRTLVEKKNTNQYFFQLIIQTEITCSPPEKVTEKKKTKNTRWRSRTEGRPGKRNSSTMAAVFAAPLVMSWKPSGKIKTWQKWVPYTWLVFHPLYPKQSKNNQGALFSLLKWIVTHIFEINNFEFAKAVWKFQVVSENFHWHVPASYFFEDFFNAFPKTNSMAKKLRNHNNHRNKKQTKSSSKFHCSGS